MNGPPITTGAPAAESAFAGATPAPAVRPGEQAETANFEREITRLTWLVLDGSATLADRQRLGELVDAQHARRRRRAAASGNPLGV